MKIKKLKLYHFPATRSARVRWALHETVGDDFEVQTVQLYSGEQYSEEYLLKNPNHNVPLLEIVLEDGSVHRMLESVAMVEWLVDAFPEKRLSPPVGQSLERADFLQMLHFGGTWMDMMLWQVRIHEHVLPSAQADSRTIERYRKKFVEEVEPQLKERLSRMPFICGEEFSGADIVIGHNVTWARGYKLCQDDIFREYLSRISKRPAFVKSFEDARDFTPEVPDKDRMKKFSG
ncbi:glutathione S-transferase family protein [Marinobacter sediminum]|uniref:glutathione S-transferase family protein n=1 Tax=Marinobacter sediminum TaxID=256323 RepID=UPI00202E12B7|nr:glutathione S-transferase family protein [Marinobacter sediminum]MCM0612417.1 glutathione S-transferase family protein [Marinobacter sediminum]